MRKTTLYVAFFVFFIDNFGFGLVYPLFGPLLLNPSYGILASELSLSTKNILLGLLYGAYPFAQFFGAPFFGSLSDNWGRKRVFYFTIAGVLIGYLATAIALLAKSYSALFFSRLMTGFFAGNMSISFAVIADLSETSTQRAKNFSFCAALGGISWVLSMLAGGDLSNPQLERFFTPSFPFWLTASILALGLLFVFLFYKETHVRKKTQLNLTEGFRHIRLAFKVKRLRWIFLAYLCWALAWVIVISWFSTISLETYGISQTKISLLLVGNGIIWFLANLFSSSYLVKKFSIKKICIAAFFLTALALVISVSDAMVLFGLFFICASGFAAIAWSSIISLISIQAPEEIQGSSLGIGQSVMALGWIFGPLIAGGVSHFKPLFAYYLAAFFLLVGLGFLLIELFLNGAHHKTVD